MVNVGIIGLGPEWETRFRPALARLPHRLRISAIYDPVASRAQAAAAEFDVVSSEGLIPLLHRKDLRAFLILDPAWHQHVPVLEACEAGKPCFVVGRFGEQAAALEQVRRSYSDRGLDCFPELRWRYFPSVTRLRELMATRLGRPKRLRLELSAHAGVNGAQRVAFEPMLFAVDLLRHFSNSPRPSSRVETPEDSLLSLSVPWGWRGDDRFEAHVALPGMGPPRAEGDAASCSGRETPFRLFAECEAGRGVVLDPFTIHSCVNGMTCEESLDAERNETEVMLDHFSRRIVGGLIPIPTLDDVLRAFDVLVEAELSRG